MHDLAKKQNVSVVLVTHDNRILDVADRIIHLEDGRISSFGEDESGEVYFVDFAGGAVFRILAVAG